MINSVSVRDGRRSAYVFVVVMILCVAGVSVVAVTQPSSVPSSLSPFCTQPMPNQSANETTLANGTRIIRSLYPVFTVAPGASISICALYFSSPGSGYSGPAYNRVYTWPSSGNLNETHDLSSSASPGDISISSGQRAYVAYNVSAADNATGFYGLSVLQICQPIPIAVSEGRVSLNASDFPGLLGDRMCPAQVIGGEVIGYSGGELSYFPTESVIPAPVNVLNVTGESVSSFPTAQGGENVTFRMNVASFDFPITFGLLAGGASITSFSAPVALKSYPHDYCSWFFTNGTQLNDVFVNSTLLRDLPNGSVRVNAPALQLGANSTATYMMSIQISGPIPSNAVLSVDYYVQRPGQGIGDGSIATYLPLSLSGQLQSVSGPCNGGGG